MAMLSRPTFAYEPTAEKIYDQPLLGFVNTRTEAAQQQQKQQRQLEEKTEAKAETVPDNPLEPSEKDLRSKCSVEGTFESETDEDESCTDSDEDGSWVEAEPKKGPEERRRAEPKKGPEERRAERKENKKKVKEEKRESRKAKIPKAEKKRRKKLAKAKCKR